MTEQRKRMVRHDIEGRGIRDARVLAAMRRVPRHAFMPPELADYAYADGPQPIGHGQTISQPYIVAAMTELIAPAPGSRILEIGTGSGYQAAVLAELAGHVFTIEIIPELADTARARLGRLGYTNITVRTGDGYLGWPDEAPFDAILVTAAPEDVPEALLRQLKPGGCLVAPVGPQAGIQELVRLKKNEDGSLSRERVMAVRFVPMVHGSP